MNNENFCWECNGKMKDKNVDYSLYGIKIGNFPAKVCEKCNETQPVKIKNVDFLKENLPGKVCHFQIDIKGICEGCSKRK